MIVTGQSLGREIIVSKRSLLIKLLLISLIVIGGGGDGGGGDGDVTQLLIKLSEKKIL